MSPVSISRARLDEINSSIAIASNIEIFCLLFALRRRLQEEQAESLLFHVDEILEAYDAAMTAELDELDRLNPTPHSTKHHV